MIGQMEAQQRDHEEKLARYYQLNSRTSQEIVNQEMLLQGNIAQLQAQLQAQLLEAQASAHKQCQTLAFAPSR